MDRFGSLHHSLDMPARSAKAVTPHASDDLADGVTRGLYVGTGGDLVVRLPGDTTDVTFKNVQDGDELPIRVEAVRDSSTAADILALY